MIRKWILGAVAVLAIGVMCSQAMAVPIEVDTGGVYEATPAENVVVAAPVMDADIGHAYLAQPAEYAVTLTKATAASSRIEQMAPGVMDTAKTASYTDTGPTATLAPIQQNTAISEAMLQTTAPPTD